MSSRGDVPATRFKEELDNICKFASKYSSSVSRPTHPSIVQTPITMVRDGMALSNCLVDVIEIVCMARGSQNAEAFQANAPDTIMDSQWPQADTQQRASLTQNLAWDASLVSTGNSVPYSNGIYIDGFNAAENPLTFDLQDLQWLDTVQ